MNERIFNLQLNYDDLVIVKTALESRKKDILRLVPDDYFAKQYCKYFDEIINKINTISIGESYGYL